MSTHEAKFSPAVIWVSYSAITFYSNPPSIEITNSGAVVIAIYLVISPLRMLILLTSNSYVVFGSSFPLGMAKESLSMFIIRSYISEEASLLTSHTYESSSKGELVSISKLNSSQKSIFSVSSITKLRTASTQPSSPDSK